MTASSLQRLAWTIWAISLAMLSIGGLIGLLGVISGQPFPRSISDLAPAILAGGTEIILATLGALIVSRQARHAIGWIFITVGLLVSLAAAAGAYATVATALPGVAVAVSLANLGQGPVLFGAFTFVFLLFPDGRLLSPRWRWVAWTAAIALLGVTLSVATLPGPLQNFSSVRNPFGIGPLNGVLHATFGLAFWVLMLTLVASAASLVLRFRRSRGEERQQLKWVASATGLAAILLLSGPLFWLVLPPNLGEWWPAVFFLAVAMILLAIGVAMLKYRLYDIDLLINRTLVYGGLTIGIVGLYVLVVGYLGNVLRTGNNNLGISLLATGVVAVLFQPLRERLQRGVNHLMYGERDDPYAVVSRLGQRLEGTLSPEALLPTIVETVAQALKLPYVAIALKHGDGYDVAAAAGRPWWKPVSKQA